MRMMFLEIVWNLFASHDVFARQQQLPNCTLFQQVLHVNVLNMVEMVFVWRTFISGLASFCRILERCICTHIANACGSG